MLRAIFYKEWLKTRWYYLVAVLLSLGFVGYVLLNFFRAAGLKGIAHLWEVMLLRDAVFVDLLQFVPLVVGLLFAVVQFVPEMQRKCLKLTLHLPCPELRMIGAMLLYGGLLLGVLFAVSLGVLFVAFRGRNPLYDRFEHLLDSLTRLARSGQNAVGIATEQVDDLILDLVDHGRIHIDLVHDGHDLQIVIQRQIKVRDSLRLNTLRRVDHEQRALARGDRTGYLVRKIDMPRSIDQVQHVLLALVDIFHLDRVALDRDSLFALEVHIVQHLSLQFALRKRLGRFEQAIGKRTLAVIDMRYDTEIADILHTFLLFVRKVS